MAVQDGEIVRVVVRFKRTGSGDIVNRYYWQYSGVGDSDQDIQTNVVLKVNEMYDNFYGQLWSGLDPFDIKADVVDWLDGKETTVRTVFVTSWTMTNAPSGGTDSMPPMDAAIINYRTLRPQTFGRKYIGGFLESVQNGGDLTSAFVTQLEAFVVDHLVDIITTNGTMNPGVLGKTFNVIDHFWPFLEGVVSSLVGTQRRRRANRGA